MRQAQIRTDQYNIQANYGFYHLSQLNSSKKRAAGLQNHIPLAFVGVSAAGIVPPGKSSETSLKVTLRTASTPLPEIAQRSPDSTGAR